MLVFRSSIKWTILGHFLTPNFTPKNLTHDNKITAKSQQKLIKSRKLTKPIKTKPQQPSPKRIDDIRKKINELKHNFIRSEFNKIRKNLYNLKHKNKFSKTSTNYLNDLNKKNY